MAEPTSNPRFCGVELEPMPYAAAKFHAFEGEVHGANVRVWETAKGWLSSAYFSFYGIEIKESLHSASAASSLLSLRGRIRNLQRALLPFEPKQPAPCSRCDLDQSGFGFDGMLPPHTCKKKRCPSPLKPTKGKR